MTLIKCATREGVSKAVEHNNKTTAAALGSKKLNVVERRKLTNW